jgi:hypothetical protein
VAELASIRAGIAASLATLNTVGLEMVEDEFVALQVSEYSLANPTMPSILVTGIEAVDYTVAFKREDVTFVASVQAFVGESHDESAQRLLDKLLMGENSVRALLSADPTFGGTVSDSFVSGQSGHKVFNLVNSKVLGAEWAVQIILTD